LEFRAGEGNETAFVECVGPVREQMQMQWWGTSNGVAKEIKTLLRQSTSDPIATASEWTSAWGEVSEFRFLTGAKGVVLSTNLPNKWSLLKAASYTLSPNCPAATWADGRQPIGADIHGIENAMTLKKPSMENKPASQNGMAPASSIPSNKKNVGF
jgi:hypothetical protein